MSRRLGAGLQHTECLNERLDTLPRTRASQKPIGHHRGMKTLGDHLGSMRCSSGLRFQLFGVETFLLLPKGQRNGRDLARLKVKMPFSSRFAYAFLWFFLTRPLTLLPP